jgi:hypothetical protein
MRSIYNRLKLFPFHSILLAIYPVVMLYANNVKEVSADVLLRPLLIALGISVLLLLLVRLVLRDWQRAGFLISLTMLLFFTYGHIYELKKTIVLLTDFWRHRYLLPLFLIALIAGVIVVLRTHKNPQLTQILNLVCIILFIYPLVQITGHSLSASKNDRQASQSPLPVRELLHTPDQPLPSVYVILVDGYMRSDALQRDLDYDNSAFVARLEDLGFYVARCSRSNHETTYDSLVTALNMDYIDQLETEIEQNHLNMEVAALIKYSKVRQSLKSIGYRTVAFDSEYDWSRISDADVFLGPNRESFIIQSINPFEAMLVKSTALRVLTDNAIRQSQLALAQANSPYNGHIDLQRYILNHLSDVASDPSPKFVFAHIIIPHWPYVFLPDGNIRDDPFDNQTERTNQEIYQGYTDSVGFLDNRLPAIFEQIITRSTTPPIIVLFGDHGLDHDNRLQNLTAIYLPGGPGDLYPSITPVNYFRIIFNDVFNAGYDILPDLSYKNIGGDRGNMQIYPETAPECLR